MRGKKKKKCFLRSLVEATEIYSKEVKEEIFLFEIPHPHEETIDLKAATTTRVGEE